jgi:hypothetical protein
MYISVNLSLSVSRHITPLKLSLSISRHSTPLKLSFAGDKRSNNKHKIDIHINYNNAERFNVRAHNWARDMSTRLARYRYIVVGHLAGLQINTSLGLAR